MKEKLEHPISMLGSVSLSINMVHFILFDYSLTSLEIHIEIRDHLSESYDIIIRCVCGKNLQD